MALFRNPFAEEIAAKPERKFLKPSTGVDVAPDDLVPNEFYFEIRLCEMYLRQAREAGCAFVPRVLAITECLYNREELTLPMAVGQKILDQLEAQMGKSGEDKVISFSNCLLAGPMPYRGADIGFFGGLYRVEREKWADSAFNLIAELTSDLGVDVSRYADIGRKLVGSLPSLLGVQSDNWRFGHHAPLYKEGDSFFDRYLVMAGADGAPLDWASIEVRQEEALETLHIGDGPTAKPFVARDFAVFRLRSRHVRGDYTRFQFDERFNEAKKLLTSADSDRFEWARLQFLQEISDSPDLTETHKLKLAAAYDLRFEKWAQVMLSGPKKRGTQKQAKTRGGSDDRVKKAIGAVAATAERKGLPPETVESFVKLSQSWNSLSTLPVIAKEEALSAEEIDTFLMDPSTEPILEGTAADFVEAIKAHRFSANA